MDRISKSDFNSLLYPKPETTEYTRAIENPVYITDSSTGISYATYTLNGQSTNVPLVAFLSWSVGVENRPGRSDVKALSDHYDGPLIVIDHEATGKSENPSRSWRQQASFDCLAASRMRVLGSLGVDNFHVAGFSMGGVVAAKVAELARERAKSLTTVSTVSFSQTNLGQFGFNFLIREGLRQTKYVREAPQSIRDEAYAGFAGEFKSLPTLLKFYRLMGASIVPQAIQNLSESTKWQDYVGSKEKVTDWKDHLKVVRDRNKLVPRSSKLYVLSGESHSWGVYSNSVATIIDFSIKTSN